MRHYQLTPSLALTLQPCHRTFKWFAGKTNRLALYNLCLCGLELNLYIARQWDYPAWDEAADFAEDDEHDAIATALPERRTQH